MYDIIRIAKRSLWTMIIKKDFFSAIWWILLYTEKESGRDFWTGENMFIKHRTGAWRRVFRGQLMKLTNVARSEDLTMEVVRLEVLIEARFFFIFLIEE